MAFKLLAMTRNDEDEHGGPNEALGLLAGCDTSCRNVYEIRPLAEIERAYIEMALKLCAGNIPRAARYLCVSPSTIYRKKAQWDEYPPT